MNGSLNAASNSVRSRASVRAFSTLDAAPLNERSWNALAASGTNSLFQVYQWHRSWVSAYGDRYEPLIVVDSNGSGVNGVAPFVIERTTAGRIIRFIGDGRADYCDILAGDDRHTVNGIVKWMTDYRHWDVMDLKNIPAQSKTIEMLRSACSEAGLGFTVRDQFLCPTLLVRGHESSAHSILRKPSLRRRHNQVTRLGKLESRHLTSAADVEPLLERFFEQHIARWDGTETPSLFHQLPNRRFYSELTERLNGTGWLLFTLVELDGRPIATHYGFDYNDAQIWYKPTFDPAYASQSPGLLLVRELIQRAVDRNLREFDFTVGNEPFKARFTNHVRKTVQIQVFRESARYYYEQSKHTMLDAARRVAASVRRRL